MGNKPIIRTSSSINSQIVALEHKVVEMISRKDNYASICALNGKIKNLKAELVKRNNFEWLAK